MHCELHKNDTWPYVSIKMDTPSKLGQFYNFLV
jgi:hypothetical protein